MSSVSAECLSDHSRDQSGLSAAELERLAAVARHAAQAGAEQLLKHFGQLERIREKGRAGDLVTEADVAAEQAVLAVLEEHTPELGVLAEESGRRAGKGSELEWCVDPLDGTTNYAHRYPFFGTSIGLTWRGQPLLGALAVPALEQLYWAAPGLGAWCNDSPISVSSCDGLASSLLVTGFAYDRHERLDNNYAEFAWFTHRTRGVRRGGAAAVDLAFVADGRLDGYAIRVPTINVSIVDLSFIAARDTTVDEVNAIMKSASEGALKGILGYNTAPLVSSDFNHDARSSIFDATLTKVAGRLVKVTSWYDNEWGFSNRMLDTTVALMAAR